MDIQVDKSHYNFDTYLTQGRWMSYYQQIREVVQCDGKEILLIGAGDGIVASILRMQGYNVKQLDIDSELNPDYCGSIDNLDTILNGKVFDIIICCQVLEHLPFDTFRNCIGQIVKHSHQAIVSLPYNHYPVIDMRVSIPLIRRKRILWTIPRFWKQFDITRDGNGEHYWELGCKGTSIKLIKRTISEARTIKRSYIYSDFPYHYFLIF